jgi:hypothetical protein
MHNKTGYRATWDPNRSFKIGQVGKLNKDGSFTVYSSLEKEGIPIEVDTSTADIEMDYTSHDSVGISFKASGKAPAVGSAFTTADAGIRFEFKSERSIVFQTSKQKTHQLVNVGEIEQHVVKKYKDGNWDKDLLIISQLVEAGTATIIIANSSNAELELNAKAGIGTGQLKLTDASLGLSTVSEKGSTIKYIAESGLTPLYTLMGIRHPWLFGKDKLVTKSTTEEIQSEEFRIIPFEEAELDD